MMKFNKLVNEILFQELEVLGYKLVDESDGLVVLASDDVKLNISFDYHRSKELDAEVLLVADHYFRPIRIHELAVYVGLPFEDRLGADEESIRNWLEDVLAFFKKTKGLVFGSDRSLLSKIEAEHREKDREYTSNLLLKQDMAKADKCFDSKDYRQVVELLQPYLERLPESYQLKYHYSLKRLNK